MPIDVGNISGQCRGSDKCQVVYCRAVTELLDTNVTCKIVHNKTRREWYNQTCTNTHYSPHNNQLNQRSGYHRTYTRKKEYRRTYNQEPYLISHLAIKGEDLMNIGITGKEIGKTLNSLCLYVIENPSKNNTDDLLKFNH